MNEIQGRDLALVLKKKGFVCSEGGNHEIYRFIHNGKVTAITVPISRGSKSSYSGGLLNRVCKEMHLTKAELSQFVECSMTRDSYLKRLQAQNKVSQEDQEQHSNNLDVNKEQYNNDLTTKE